MRRSLRIPVLSVYLLLAAWAAAQAVQPMLRIEGESLAGNKVVLPDAAKGKVAVLIFGFTKASKTPTSTWAKRLNADFATQPGIVLYQLPVLEDVPRLFRGMVISGIKKGVPENLREQFVPIVAGEAELKKLVSYKEPNDAYLIVLDRSGRVAYQQHWSSPDSAYPQMQSEIQSLLNQR